MTPVIFLGCHIFVDKRDVSTWSPAERCREYFGDVF